MENAAAWSVDLLKDKWHKKYFFQFCLIWSLNKLNIVLIENNPLGRPFYWLLPFEIVAISDL